jgi:hypothetical protein
VYVIAKAVCLLGARRQPQPGCDLIFDVRIRLSNLRAVAASKTYLRVLAGLLFEDGAAGWEVTWPVACRTREPSLDTTARKKNLPGAIEVMRLGLLFVENR